MKNIDLYNRIAKEKVYGDSQLVSLDKVTMLDVKNAIDFILDDRDKKLKNQTADNKSLINKIEILNTDIRNLVSDANKVNSEIKQTIDMVEPTKEKLIINTLGITSLFFLVTTIILYVNQIHITNEYKTNIEYIKDSINTVYSDTVIVYNDIINNQRNELITSTNRFNYVIDYYTSSREEQTQMNEVLNELISIRHNGL